MLCVIFICIVRHIRSRCKLHAIQTTIYSIVPTQSCICVHVYICNGTCCHGSIDVEDLEEEDRKIIQNEIESSRLLKITIKSNRSRQMSLFRGQIVNLQGFMAIEVDV